MSYTEFEWDARKERSNVRKHGISFQSACSLFDQPYLAALDPRGTYGEDRWLAIGWIEAMLGVVVFTERFTKDGARTLRIISARKASSNERQRYEKEI